MSLTAEELLRLLEGDEHENLEFKEAKHQFDTRKLMEYAVALANEGGGRLILGVSAKPQRKIVGTRAFQDLQKIKLQVLHRLRFRIDVDELLHENRRVVVFTIPARSLGMPLQVDGKYLMRSGESLVGMTQELLKRILEETGPDFSAEPCKGTTIADLAPEAIETYRSLWHRKSGSEAILSLSDEQLLADAEFILDGVPTYAAIILLGDREAIARNIPQAEIIFEYRSSETSQSFQQRLEYRTGFFLCYEGVWNAVNARNDIQQYQNGLFRWDIATFDEAVVREAILNAVSHRDYRLGNSIMIRQFPRKLEITSPGGFIEGVTPENILWRQAWRNRRIAEVLSKCGLVERSGQGANRMFEQSIRSGKPVPDFVGTDDYQVSLTLHGEVQDLRFLNFLERIGQQRLSSFATDDFLVLDYLHREEVVPQRLAPRLPSLCAEGVIERIGRGRGTRHILSRELHAFLREPGTYTRKRGLDRETNKTLLLKHIADNRHVGSCLEELRQVLPDLSGDQVQGLMRELKAEKRIYHTGRTRGSRWYPAL